MRPVMKIKFKHIVSDREYSNLKIMRGATKKNCKHTKAQQNCLTDVKPLPNSDRKIQRFTRFAQHYKFAP